MENLFKVIELIGDLKDSTKNYLLEKYKNSDLNVNNLSKVISIDLKLKCVNKTSIYYWTSRGWTEEEAEEKRTKKKNKNSPFKIEFWTEKGYTEEEARYKTNSFRKCNIEYWTSRGYTEEEAKIQISEFSRRAGKIYSKKLKDNPKRYQGILDTQVLYWIKKGYTEEESIEKVKERQRTVTLEKMIKRYGEKEGTVRYHLRTKRWLETLNSKSDEEKKEINKKKSRSFKTILKECNYDKQKAVEVFIKSQGIKNFIYNYDEYLNKLIDIVNTNYAYLYSTFEWFSKHNIAQYYLDYFEISKKQLKKDLYKRGIEFPKQNIIFFNTRGGFRHWKLITNSGKILRSSHEINFYHLLKENNIEYEIEKYYEGTNLRCDFYLPKYNHFIEIVGDIKNDYYISKMLYKQSKFGSILIASNEEQLDFIERLINDKDISMYIGRSLRIQQDQ
jgi:hypothetical protein